MVCCFHSYFPYIIITNRKRPGNVLMEGTWTPQNLKIIIVKKNFRYHQAWIYSFGVCFSFQLQREACAFRLFLFLLFASFFATFLLFFFFFFFFLASLIPFMYVKNAISRYGLFKPEYSDLRLRRKKESKGKNKGRHHKVFIISFHKPANGIFLEVLTTIN